MEFIEMLKAVGICSCEDHIADCSGSAHGTVGPGPCPYLGENYHDGCEKQLLKDVFAYMQNRTLLERKIVPIRVCRTQSDLGVGGVLKVGFCPDCDGIGAINNRDNTFCGGCGRRVDWNAV